MRRAVVLFVGRGGWFSYTGHRADIPANPPHTKSQQDRVERGAARACHRLLPWLPGSVKGLQPAALFAMDKLAQGISFCDTKQKLTHITKSNHVPG